MNKKEVEKEIDKLKKLVEYHRYLYHVYDRQEISEEVLDSLKKRLFDLEQKYPEFITPDSPTQRVGGKPLEKFEKVTHPKRMFSFNDAFSEEDIRDWLKRISKILNHKEKNKLDFYCELKMDGLAIELIYKNEFLEKGLTRGDGVVGENVTQNIKTINSIPLKIGKKGEIIKRLKKESLLEISRQIQKEGLKEIVVRGEAFISKKEFERINKEREREGLSLYSNPRNIAAGSIRQLDSKITASRNLDSYAYDLVTDLGQKTHQEVHKILEILGFKTNNKNNKYCKNLEEVFKFHAFWQKNRNKIPYEFDGIVVNINSIDIFKKLGTVGKTPRGAIAFKFPLKQSVTKVKDIKIQIGRTGALTPVAVLEPVKIEGVTISRATLHNEDEIKRLNLKIGDTVVVGRAGDVIPGIMKALKELRTGKEKIFRMPKKCPSCGSIIKKEKNNIVWKCKNRDCFARKKRLFYHFISRKAFNIDGLGSQTVDQLLNEGLIETPADLFELKKGDLISLERFGEKSAKNVIESIANSRKITLTKYIYSLGIAGVGEQTAQDLAEYFQSMEGLKKSSKEQLGAIKDIGPIVSESIYYWFKNSKNLKLLDKTKEVGITIESEKIKKQLKGKIFVITGSLNGITRETAKEKIKRLGGKFSDSISQKTSYLVRGGNPGSKLEKAKELKVKIIDEKKFLQMIE